MQGGIANLQSLFDFFYGVENGGVILAKLCADGGEREVCQLPNEIHRNMPGFGYGLCSLVATENRLVNGVELTDLTDNQIGCGQRTAFALEHIADGAGNIGKIQGHIV